MAAKDNACFANSKRDCRDCNETELGSLPPREQDREPCAALCMTTRQPCLRRRLYDGIWWCAKHQKDCQDRVKKYHDFEKKFVELSNSLYLGNDEKKEKSLLYQVYKKQSDEFDFSKTDLNDPLKRELLRNAIENVHKYRLQNQIFCHARETDVEKDMSHDHPIVRYGKLKFAFNAAFPRSKTPSPNSSKTPSPTSELLKIEVEPDSLIVNEKEKTFEKQGKQTKSKKSKSEGRAQHEAEVKRKKEEMKLQKAKMEEKKIEDELKKKREQDKKQDKQYKENAMKACANFMKSDVWMKTFQDLRPFNQKFLQSIHKTKIEWKGDEFDAYKFAKARLMNNYNIPLIYVQDFHTKQPSLKSIPFIYADALTQTSMKGSEVFRMPVWFYGFPYARTFYSMAKTLHPSFSYLDLLDLAIGILLVWIEYFFIYTEGEKEEDNDSVFRAVAAIFGGPPVAAFTSKWFYDKSNGKVNMQSFLNQVKTIIEKEGQENVFNLIGSRFRGATVASFSNVSFRRELMNLWILLILEQLFSLKMKETPQDEPKLMTRYLQIIQKFNELIYQYTTLPSLTNALVTEHIQFLKRVDPPQIVLSSLLLCARPPLSY